MKTTKFIAILAVAASIMTACSKQSDVSEDLRLRDLRGNVVSVKLFTQNLNDEGKPIGIPRQVGIMERFDENGKIVTSDVNIERNKQGRIISYCREEMVEACDESENDSPDRKRITERYVYNGQGDIIEKTVRDEMLTYTCLSEYASKLFYDQNNNLIKQTTHVYSETEGSEPYEWNEETEYSIIETDGQGNWIKRQVHLIQNFSTRKYTHSNIETREITYRKEDKSSTKEANKPSEATQSKKSPNSNFMEGLEGIDDSDGQFYNDQSVMIYLSNHKFVSGDDYITFGYDGMYFNGVCQTGAIEVLSFNATQAKCMADSPYNGRYIFIVDCEDGSLRLHTGDTFYTDNY